MVHPTLPSTGFPIALLATLLCIPGCDGERGRNATSVASASWSAGDGAEDGDAAGDGDDDDDDDRDDDDDDDNGDANDDDDDDDNAKFDIGSVPDGGPTDDGCPDDDADGKCDCTIPEHVACDDGTSDPFAAMGLGCPGELQVDAAFNGAGSARGVRSSFGGTATFDPREGSVYAVIGSGNVAELDTETPAGDSDAFPTHCNDDLGDYDPGESLPLPLRAVDVTGDCTMDATLIGSGDCSNTVAEQFDQGSDANDYTELRFSVSVPQDVISFSYDFAFFSTEYPTYFGSGFNDMYVGWLESEKWTGNISFDNEGNPISLNAGFLDFKDDGGNTPELAGTCMKQHAGTDWLTTTAGVTPGEDITVVFAIFDLSDSILDSYAFIDNFQWGCDPSEKPQTQPEG